MQKTVAKAFRIIELIAKEGNSVGLSDIARKTELDKSNVHRLLSTLTELGYAHQIESSRHYALTLKFLELGGAIVSSLDFKQVAGEYLSRLAESTHETVLLAVLQDEDVVYIDKIESTQPVRTYTNIGGRAIAHCTATGKALLAFKSSEYIEQVARNLTRHTRFTITDRKKFLTEVCAIQESGTAVSRGEWKEEVWGVASPVRDSTGSVIASVGVTAPATRLTEDRIARVAPSVKEAAEGISRMLGYNHREC